MTSLPETPALRVRPITAYEIQPQGEFVVYWMTAFRRRRYNYALQHAALWAERLQKPLLVVEALRTGYQWACDRFHRFVIDGMLANQADFASADVLYFPFLESRGVSGHGMIESLARRACLVVTDDFPTFFHPVLYRRIVRHWPAAVHLVDSNGILPMRAAERTFTVAHSFRRYLQKALPAHLEHFPLEDCLQGLKLPKMDRIPSFDYHRWPVADLSVLESGTNHFDQFAINHEVPPATIRGGATAAQAQLRKFISQHLDRYEEDRNVPDLEGGSRLSPYLHFGHISAHEVFTAAMNHANWSMKSLKKPNGKALGYWGATPQVEAFLDELITWREIGFNMAHREPDYDRYESLPEWAKTTLAEHASDPREKIYSFADLEHARTADDLWNAAQRELVRDGRIHNYLRMLWGKKLLQWTPDARTALKYLIELNNKYALDGRNPNSYSGIFWVFGRFDRAWGPERKIFGKVRYMTSDSTRRKFPMKEYLKKYGP